MRPLPALVLTAFMAGTMWSAMVEGADRGAVTVRFPAFALSPGERIMGVRLSASAGRIFAGCHPNRWTCDGNGSEIHCYSLHPTYATAISGMLPEFIVSNNDGGRPSLQASVEFIDNNGKEYSREMREGDLIVR